MVIFTFTAILLAMLTSSTTSKDLSTDNPIVSEWQLKFITEEDVSGYALDELLHDYLQSSGGKKALELGKFVLLDLLEGLFFPSGDENNGKESTLRKSILPLVQIVFTPDEKGTSIVDEIIAIFEPYLIESFGFSPAQGPPELLGISLDFEKPNGQTFLRLVTELLGLKRINFLLGDYLRQVLALTVNKDKSIVFKDALLEAAIHELSCPSSEDILNKLTTFLLKDVILDSTDLVQCGVTSALNSLLATLAGNPLTLTFELRPLLTDETIEKWKNLGKKIFLQAFEMKDTHRIFGRLKYLLDQNGLPLPADKLIYVGLRAAVNSESIGSGDSISLPDLMEAIKGSGLNISSMAESLVLSVLTSKDAPMAFFNIFDTFPILAKEVPALSNLPNMNFVELLADFL
uniref:Uncharacterized protein n=1 Tax=Schistocephalus solidus TaxID=70667 RepID=A0A0X3Q160_SCHSO